MTKILLVEDDKSLREIYGVRLLAEGYDIVSAGDGEEALAMAIKEKPTLIISDVMMPKISGFDMLDILRSTTETRDIKVIMMTALSSDDQRTRGEQLGADRYLVKSQVGIEDVVRTVHEVLEDTSGAATPAAAAPQTPPATVDATPPAPEPAAPSEPVVADDDTDAAVPAPPTDEPDTTPSATPVDDGPGPLPIQPTESVLPQPTAPFSSPRPTNLGERVIHPLGESESESDSTPATSPEVSDQIAQELKTSSEPVPTAQADETNVAVDAPVEPSPSPVADTSMPVPTSPVTGLPTVTPPSEDDKPVVSPPSTPIS